MAITRSNIGLDVVFDAGRTFFQHKLDQMRKAWVRHKVFRTTYHELSSLSDRDLRDLGIPRRNIKRLALEAAYDQ